MPIEKKPYTDYGDEKQDKITVRMSQKERAHLEEWKKALDVQRDSTCLKILASIGGNVIRSSFGMDNIAFLLKRDRVRYDYVK